MQIALYKLNHRYKLEFCIVISIWKLNKSFNSLLSSIYTLLYIVGVLFSITVSALTRTQSMSTKVMTFTVMRTHFGTKANYCQGKYWFQLLRLPPYGDIYYTLLGEGNIRRRFMAVIFGPWRKKGSSANVEEGSKGMRWISTFRLKSR